MRMKALKTCMTAAILCLALGFSSYAGSWKNDGFGQWYQEDDGSYPAAEWKEIGGKWYYFNSRGYLAVNCWIGDEYYVGSDGAMLVSTMTPDGYYVDANGRYQPGNGDTASKTAVQSSSADTNTIQMTIDGVRETFYLVDSGGSGKKYRYFQAYTVDSNNTIGKMLELHFSPELSSGATVTQEDGGFYLYYLPSALDSTTKYRADWNKASYTCTITVNESSASHVEGTFSAKPKQSGGSKTVTITDGTFNLNLGESVASAKEIYDSAKGSKGSSASYSGSYVDSGTGTSAGSSSSKVDHTCRTCHGSGICTGCGGDGLKRNSYDGSVDTCVRCRGTGRCTVCAGTGKVY